MRKPRILITDATYHVTSKIDHGDKAMKAGQIKRLFLDFVRKAKEKFEFELWNFTILENHFHFLIKPARGTSLSRILQWIKCNFAKAWNKMHKRTGHVWGERFFSRIIKDKQDFETVDNYINENAVKAGLVEKAEDWSFGGLFYRIKGTFGLIDELPDLDTLFTFLHRLYAGIS